MCNSERNWPIPNIIIKEEETDEEVRADHRHCSGHRRCCHGALCRSRGHLRDRVRVCL